MPIEYALERIEAALEGMIMRIDFRDREPIRHALKDIADIREAVPDKLDSNIISGEYALHDGRLTKDTMCHVTTYGQGINLSACKLLQSITATQPPTTKEK